LLRCVLCKRQQHCANSSNAAETLCNHLKGHAVLFILSMLKTSAVAWRLHSVLDSPLWQRCGNAVGSSRAPLWARHVKAVKTPYKFCIWSRRWQCILIIKQMIIKCIKIYKVFVIINANGKSFN